MADTFEIEGLKDFIKDLEGFTKDAEKEMVPFVDKSGDLLLSKTKQKVNVDTGKLKNSLFLRRLRPRNGVTRNILTWGDDVRDYAAPLELGHNLVLFGKRTLKHIAARPFMRPAADESKEKVFKTLIIGLNIIINKLGDKK